MKRIAYILLAVVSVAFVACQNKDEDLTESIFDTETPAVDPNSATAVFDQWLYDNFVTKYNAEIEYKFNLLESNLDYQLTPAGYVQSQVLARLLLYLFYEPYEEKNGFEFMRQNSPREFHFIGSNGVNATSGTEMLGYASGGIKITLLCVNRMNMDLGNWTASDMLRANQDYFHTMHHEFSHILHQRKTIPSTFRQISSQIYDPLNWQGRDSVESHQMGCVTNYASSAIQEDFVETLSCIITDDDDAWMTRIINATLPGVRSGDKAEALAFIDSLRIKGLDDAASPWNNFSIFRAELPNGTLKKYCTSRNITEIRRDRKWRIDNGYDAFRAINDSTFFFYDGSGNGDSTYFRRVAVVSPVGGRYSGFRDYLRRYVQNSGDSELLGMNAMLRKIDIATTWYTEKWGINLYQLRSSVQARQDTLNDYVLRSIVPNLHYLD